MGWPFSAWAMSGADPCEAWAALKQASGPAAVGVGPEWPDAYPSAAF